MWKKCGIDKAMMAMSKESLNSGYCMSHFDILQHFWTRGEVRACLTNDRIARSKVPDTR